MERGRQEFEMLDLEHRILTPHQERRLIALAKGEGQQASRAFDKLVLLNLRLVAKQVRKQAHRSSLPVEDLMQEGVLGLMRAIEKFELERKVRLSTYAVWWIQQSIRRAQEDTARTIRLPVHQQNRLDKLGWARSNLRSSLGREPEPEEIAESLQWDSEEIDRAEALSRLGLAGDPLSLDAAYLTEDTEGGFTVGDTIPADEEPVEQKMDDSLEVQYLRKALYKLSDEHREILMRRFGFGGKNETLADIASEWGLSQERVRQKQARAIHKLQAYLGPAVMHYRNIGDGGAATPLLLTLMEEATGDSGGEGTESSTEEKTAADDRSSGESATCTASADLVSEVRERYSRAARISSRARTEEMFSRARAS